MQHARKIEGLWSIVLIELTNACNFHCAFCPSDSLKRKKAAMPRALWEKVLRELGEKKMTKTVFFHLLGEPLLHKDVYDAIRFANDQGLSVSLYSNGALFDEERTDKVMQALSRGRIVLSMQDIAPDTFDQRCHHALSWEAYIDRLRNVMIQAEKRKVTVQIHCMVDMKALGWNFVQITRLQKTIQKMYQTWLRSLQKTADGTINILNPARTYPLGEYTSFFVKHKGSWGNHLVNKAQTVIPGDTGHCDLMHDTFGVFPDGSCTYCCGDYESALDLGNANQDTLEDIYYGEKATRIREAEEKGLIIHEWCKICKGTLVDSRTLKRVSSRNLIAEYFFFLDHLKRYGIASTVKKTIENVNKRVKKISSSGNC